MPASSFVRTDRRPWMYAPHIDELQTVSGYTLVMEDAMPVAGSTLHSITVWLDDSGKLHEGAIEHRHKSACYGLDAAMAILDAAHKGTRVSLIMYGDNLTQLRLAFNGEEAGDEPQSL